MAGTSARLLTLLSLLQSPREWPGSELARRLEVSPRTVRRDIERLRDLGYPVEASLGGTGGYRLVAGAAMPPLLLDDEEAVAIAIGLRTVAGNPVEGIGQASANAMAKLQQVLPSRLRHRVNALNTAMAGPAPVPGPVIDPEVLTVLASAVATGERLRFAYTSGRRLVEPQRLVVVGRRWYLLAFDLDRDDWRIFRVDRVREPFATGARPAARALPFEDATAFVIGKLHTLVPVYHATATLHAPAERIRARLADTGVEVVPIDADTCRLDGHTDTLDWLAFRLLTLECEFEVHDPPELRAHLRAMAERALRAV
ncbi:YafY family transcriptional regulator [Nonomuraea sp. NBC_01738]|uniref:helix-turn-helix transcriptional regulator n=1 Tax=Nonomuraea sp. NBC_01738 TaxID=2976003 RepID=UPI002E12AABA|nr:YafY family transcriptional regulator [Nonomuraea sp. NBC_01738]